MTTARALLGTVLDGDLNDLLTRPRRAGKLRGQHAGLTWEQLTQHAVVLGGTGSGKTVTQLRLAQAMMALSDANPCEPPIRILFLDAKGLPDGNRELFRRIADAHGRTVRCWPEEPLDGFSGSQDQLRERLSGLWNAEESPFHHAEAVTLLDLALQAEPMPRTFRDLLDRVRPGATVAAYLAECTQDGLQRHSEASSFTTSQWNSLYLRLRALQATLGTSLDAATPNGWTLRDTDTAWISIPGTRAPQAAADSATWLLRLLSELATDPDHTKTLVFLDEFSAIGHDQRAGRAAASLIERTRAAGLALVLGTQTTASLGDAGPRLLQTAGTVITHRSSAPEDIVTLAGTVNVWEDAHRIGPLGLRQAESGRLQSQFRVNPDLVRALPAGEAVIIRAGRWAHVWISRPR
jgi:hypothetical protein